MIFTQPDGREIEIKIKDVSDLADALTAALKVSVGTATPLGKSSSTSDSAKDDLVSKVDQTKLAEHIKDAVAYLKETIETLAEIKTNQQNHINQDKKGKNSLEAGVNSMLGDMVKSTRSFHAANQDVVEQLNETVKKMHQAVSNDAYERTKGGTGHSANSFKGFGEIIEKTLGAKGLAGDMQRIAIESSKQIQKVLQQITSRKDYKQSQGIDSMMKGISDTLSSGGEVDFDNVAKRTKEIFGDTVDINDLAGKLRDTWKDGSKHLADATRSLTEMDGSVDSLERGFAIINNTLRRHGRELGLNVRDYEIIEEHLKTINGLEGGDLVALSRVLDNRKHLDKFQKGNLEREVMQLKSAIDSSNETAIKNHLSNLITVAQPLKNFLDSVTKRWGEKIEQFGYKIQSISYALKRIDPAGMGFSKSYNPIEDGKKRIEEFNNWSKQITEATHDSMGLSGAADVGPGSNKSTAYGVDSMISKYSKLHYEQTSATEDISRKYVDNLRNLNDIFLDTGVDREVAMKSMVKNMRRGITSLEKWNQTSRQGLRLGYLIGADAEATADELADWSMYMGLSNTQTGLLAKNVQQVGRLTGVTGNNLLEAVKSGRTLAESMRDAGTYTDEAAKSMIQYAASAKKMGTEKSGGPIMEALAGTVNLFEKANDKTWALLSMSAQASSNPAEMMNAMTEGRVHQTPGMGKEFGESMEKVLMRFTNGRKVSDLSSQEKMQLNLVLSSAFGMQLGEFERTIKTVKDTFVTTADKIKENDKQFKNFNNMTQNEKNSLLQEKAVLLQQQKEEDMNNVVKQLLTLKESLNASPEKAAELFKSVGKDIETGFDKNKSVLDAYLGKDQSGALQQSIKDAMRTGNIVAFKTQVEAFNSALEKSAVSKKSSGLSKAEAEKNLQQKIQNDMATAMQNAQTLLSAQLPLGTAALASIGIGITEGFASMLVSSGNLLKAIGNIYDLLKLVIGGAGMGAMFRKFGGGGAGGAGAGAGAGGGMLGSKMSPALTGMMRMAGIGYLVHEGITGYNENGVGGSASKILTGRSQTNLNGGGSLYGGGWSPDKEGLLTTGHGMAAAFMLSGGNPVITAIGGLTSALIELTKVSYTLVKVNQELKGLDNKDAQRIENKKELYESADYRNEKVSEYLRNPQKYIDELKEKQDAIAIYGGKIEEDMNFKVFDVVQKTGSKQKALWDELRGKSTEEKITTMRKDNQGWITNEMQAQFDSYMKHKSMSREVENLELPTVKQSNLDVIKKLVTDKLSPDLQNNKEFLDLLSAYEVQYAPNKDPNFWKNIENTAKTKYGVDLLELHNKGQSEWQNKQKQNGQSNFVSQGSTPEDKFVSLAGSQNKLMWDKALDISTAAQKSKESIETAATKANINPAQKQFLEEQVMKFYDDSMGEKEKQEALRQINRMFENFSDIRDKMMSAVKEQTQKIKNGKIDSDDMWQDLEFEIKNQFKGIDSKEVTNALRDAFAKATKGITDPKEREKIFKDIFAQQMAINPGNMPLPTPEAAISSTTGGSAIGAMAGLIHRTGGNAIGAAGGGASALIPAAKIASSFAPPVPTPSPVANEQFFKYLKIKAPDYDTRNAVIRDIRSGKFPTRFTEYYDQLGNKMNSSKVDAAEAQKYVLDRANGDFALYDTPNISSVMPALPSATNNASSVPMGQETTKDAVRRQMATTQAQSSVTNANDTMADIRDNTGQMVDGITEHNELLQELINLFMSVGNTNNPGDPSSNVKGSVPTNTYQWQSFIHSMNIFGNLQSPPGN